MGVHGFQRDLNHVDLNHVDLDGFIVYGTFTIANEIVLPIITYCQALATVQILNEQTLLQAVCLTNYFVTT